MLPFSNAAMRLVAAGACACAFLAGVQAQLSATLGLSEDNLQKNGISIGKSICNSVKCY